MEMALFEQGPQDLGRVCSQTLESLSQPLRDVGASPLWGLITLSQLSLGQGLKPALAVAAEARGGMPPLYRAYSNALLACKTHAGSSWQAGNL